MVQCLGRTASFAGTPLVYVGVPFMGFYLLARWLFLPGVGDCGRADWTVVDGELRGPVLLCPPPHARGRSSFRGRRDR